MLLRFVDAVDDGVDVVIIIAVVLDVVLAVNFTAVVVIAHIL